MRIMSANPNNVNTPAWVDMRTVKASWSRLMDVVRSLNGNTRALRGGNWIAYPPWISDDLGCGLDFII